MSAADFHPAPTRRAPSRIWVVLLVGAASYLVALLLAAYLGPVWFTPTPTPAAPASSSLDTAQAVVLDGSATFSSIPGRLTVTLTLAPASPPRLLTDDAPVEGGRMSPSELSSRIPELAALTPAALVAMTFLPPTGSRVSVLARLSEPPVLDATSATLVVQLSLLDAPGAGGTYTSGTKADLPASSSDVTITFFATR